MKNIIILLMFLCPVLIFAQKEGTISFEEKTKIEIQVPEDSPISKEELEKMMPSDRTESFSLHFTPEASLYKTVAARPNEEEINQIGEEGDAIQIKMIRATNENIIYHDIKSNNIVQQQDFMGKTFLIKDTTQKYAWKISKESKKIEGYTCQKATLEEEDRLVEAWFTTAIPVATGPSGFYQLPGMILELHVKGTNSERWLTTTKVSLEKLDKNTIVAPKKGKIVSRADYKTIIEEKKKEMEESMGGSGIIRVRKQ